MKDAYFSNRIYESPWVRNEFFAAHGDTQNFWIDLAYYCNRDDYDAVKQTRGTALDFDILDGDGNEIFAGLSAELLAELVARGYKLLDSNVEIVGSEADLYRVTETYGYAPNRTYVSPDWDIVKIFALEDSDMSTSTNVVQDSTNATLCSQFWRNAIIKVSDASAFKTGDKVVLHFPCTFGWKDPDGVAPNRTFEGAWVDTEEIEILSIDRTAQLVELSMGNFPTLNLDDNFHDSYYHINHKVYDAQAFLRWVMGEQIPAAHNLTLWPTSAQMVRVYAYREAKNRQRQIRKKVSYHESEPTPAEVFTPQKESGGEAEKISRLSIPNNTQWKTRVAAAEWYTYKAAEVELDERTGIYKMTQRETRCE